MALESQFQLFFLEDLLLGTKPPSDKNHSLSSASSLASEILGLGTLLV